MAEAIDSNCGDLGVAHGKSVRLQRMLHDHATNLLEFISGKLPADLHSFVDAGDVLQDVFFEAFQRIGEFEPRVEDAAYRWLVTIARHRVLALIRMQRASKRGGGRRFFAGVDDVGGVESVLEELAVYTRTPSQSAMSHELAVAVQNSMRQIEPQYQEVIQLRYIDGLSVKQSAERMGRTEGAIFMLCNRGLKSLKERLVAAGGVVR